MNLYKYIKYMFLVTLVAITLVLLFPLITRNAGKYTVDSGFDSSYDSGGSSGSSSSWDSSSSHSESKSESSTPEEIIKKIINIFICCSVIISIGILWFQLEKLIYYYKVLSNFHKKLLIIYTILSIVPIVHFFCLIHSSLICKKYEKKTLSSDDLKKYGLDTNIIIQQSFSIYKKIQIAWMNGDVDPVRDVLSDEIYNMYKTQLMTLKAKKQKNIMEDIKYKKGTIKNVKEAADDVAIEIILEVTCRDYIINIENNKVVRGNKNHICNYKYSLTFTFNKNDAKVITNCPGCNAKLPIEGKSIKCEYCGTTIKRESTNLVMTKKTMISQS